jgi:hypothetical protein
VEVELAEGVPVCQALAETEGVMEKAVEVS